MTTRIPKEKLIVIFVVGCPGSGKTTQCLNIAQLYGFTHLSPSDLLQRETGQSEYSTLMRSMVLNLMNMGNLVPSELVVKLLQREIDNTVNHKYVVDAFPWDKESYDEWKNVMGIEPKLVLNFDCPEEVILGRLNELQEGDVDKIKKGFNLFSRNSPSLISHFDSNGTLARIHAECSAEEVFEKIKPIFSLKNLDVGGCFFNKANKAFWNDDPKEIWNDEPEFRDEENQGDQENQLNVNQEDQVNQGDQENQLNVNQEDQVNQVKRKAEGESSGREKKMKMHIVGPAKRAIRLALKDLGVKVDDFSYLDRLTTEEYLKELRDVVVMMAGRVDAIISPVVIASTTTSMVPYDNLTISQMVELGIKEVEGTLHCANCITFQKAKVDWREGFVCLASYMLGKFFKEELLKPPSNLSFSVPCSNCEKESTPYPCTEGSNFLFLAFTYSIGLCPREFILGYLRERSIEIASQDQDSLLFTFYLAVITQLDPTIVVWKKLRCSMADATSNG